MLQRIKIGPKITIISVMAMIGLIAVTLFELMSLRTALLEDRKEKIRAATEFVVSLADEYQAKVTAKEMDQQAAIDAFYTVVAAGKYDGGIGYFFALSKDNVMVMHGANAGLVGKDMSGTQDPNGAYFIRELVEVGSKPAGGFSSYQSPKPGEPKEITIEKLSYSHLLPWGEVI